VLTVGDDKLNVRLNTTHCQRLLSGDMHGERSENSHGWVSRQSGKMAPGYQHSKSRDHRNQNHDIIKLSCLYLNFTC